MGDGDRPSIAARLRELGWAAGGAAVGLYVAVQLLAAIWLWIVLGGLTIGTVMTLAWLHQRREF